MDQIQQYLTNRESLAERAEDFLDALARQFEKSGFSGEAETVVAQDVHGFFRLADKPSVVLHIQLYPGLSSDRELFIAARFMNREQMLELRVKEDCSPGNEHDAVIGGIEDFPRSGKMIPWDEVWLSKELAPKD